MLVVLLELEGANRKMGGPQSAKCVGKFAAVNRGPWYACAPSGPIPFSPSPVPLTCEVLVCGLGDTSYCSCPRNEDDHSIRVSDGLSVGFYHHTGKQGRCSYVSDDHSAVAFAVDHEGTPGLRWVASTPGSVADIGQPKRRLESRLKLGDTVASFAVGLLEIWPYFVLLGVQQDDCPT